MCNKHSVRSLSSLPLKGLVKGDALPPAALLIKPQCFPKLFQNNIFNLGDQFTLSITGFLSDTFCC